MEEVGKYAVVSDITREDISKLCLTEDLLGWYEWELLVWHHRMNHCSFKYLLILSKRGIIPNNISRVRKLPPCVAFLFGNYHKRPWRTKGKLSGGSISNPLETIPGAMNSIDHIFSSQPELIPQVTRNLTHTIFWSATLYLYHYSKYFYTHIMRGDSYE